ncbi:lipid-A-disaccharide synthase [Saccharospirillum impatiens]|uniref:lipid-A-disaccharide synthase n=1 Tax=Saccharospirillum impatiens TaxID=169438 RepID=UPI000409606D|nr:lipid-A-disaccharide synthase [Saccharospirillum impatiens]
MSRRLRVAVLAGEASGDILGAGLMRALRARYPDVEFGGIGGERMVAQGLDSRVSMERLSVMGLTEVLGRLRELFRIRAAYRDWCIHWQPDVFVGIDAPDFNLGLERQLRDAGIKTVHYVSPSVWAWRQGRIKKIRRSVDHMLTLLPFEADFYRQHQVPVTFVGHTLADQLPMEPDRSAARDRLGVPQQGLCLAILPGSRGSEVGRLAPLFLQAATLAQETLGPLNVLIPAANEFRREQIEAAVRQHGNGLHIQLYAGQSTDVMVASDGVLLASGTAALEAMLLKRPMVVSYRLTALTFRIMRAMATTRWVSLPNILTQSDWVPERLQDDATPGRLATDLIRVLTDSNYRDQFEQRSRFLHRQLARGADEQAAQAVLAVAGVTAE